MSLPERDEKTLDKLRALRDQGALSKTGDGPLRRYYHEQLLRQIRFNVPKGSTSSRSST